MNNTDYVEGRNSVLELLKSNNSINRLYVQKGERHGSITDIIKFAKSKGIIISEVDKQKMNSLSSGNHQGVIATIPPYNYVDLGEILEHAKQKNEDAFVILLDEIEDPHNLGSIIRTAEILGAHGLVITSRRSATVNSTVNKVSSGATEYLKIAKVNNLNECIKELKEKGLWIIGTDISAQKLCYDQDLKGPVGVVIGNEGKGMSRLTKENCDILVKIPMKGNISSFNASVSSGIIMYEIYRQRGR